MAFNKIQPEQIQLHTFFSDSGDLDITPNDTGVKINISRSLTGTFAVTGDVKVNNKSVLTVASSATNTFNVDSGNVLLQGTDTEFGVGQDAKNNFAIVANSSEISGVGNVSLNVTDAIYDTGSRFNTILAGDNVTLADAATGNTILKDANNATTLIVDGYENALVTNFDGGHFFLDGENYFQNDAFFAQNSSGVFSGELNVLGNSFIDQPMKFNTGFALPLWSGNGSQAGTSATPATGALAISGTKLLVYTGNGSVQGWGQIAIGTSP
tara:strand:- start:2646 stop:3449 length:804 start_codon:yes stop_codon:yes gene_type:complete